MHPNEQRNVTSIGLAIRHKLAAEADLPQSRLRRMLAHTLLLRREQTEKPVDHRTVLQELSHDVAKISLESTRES